METNEIMNVDLDNDEIMDVEVVEDDKSLSTAGAMLIGAAVTAATVAVVKLGKKVIAKVKARKAKTENDIVVELVDEDDEADAK